MVVDDGEMKKTDVDVVVREYSFLGTKKRAPWMLVVSNNESSKYCTCRRALKT